MSLAIKSISRGFARIFNLPRLSLSLIVALGSTLGAVLCVAAISSALMLKPLPGVSNAPLLKDVDIHVLFGGKFKLDFMIPHALNNASDYFKDIGEWTAINPSRRTLAIKDIDYEITLLAAKDNAPNVLGTKLVAGNQVEPQRLTSHVWISKSLWQTAYGGLTKAIGQSLTIGENTYLIAGVFEDALAVVHNQQILSQQIWQFDDYKKAQPFNRQNSVGNNALDNVIFKPNHEQSVPSRKEISTWYNQYIANEVIEPHVKEFIERMPMDFEINDYRENFLDSNYYLVIVLGLVASGLLFMATLNLINLFLSYYQTRTKEFAMQLTLGASQVKLRCLMILENLPSFILAGILGTLTGSWLIKALPLFTNNKLPLLTSIHIDGNTIALCLIIVVFLAALFGCISLTNINKTQLQANLNSSGKGTAAQATHTLSRILMVLQIAIASILCTGSVMLAKQSYDFVFEDLGYDITKNVQELRLSVNNDDWVEKMEIEHNKDWRNSDYRRFIDSLSRDIETLIPDSKVILVNNGGLLSSSYSIRADQYGEEPPYETVTYSVKRFDPGYFEEMNIQILAGNIPTRNDIDNHSNKYVIDEIFAKQLFPNQTFKDIIGQPFPFHDEKVVGAIVEKTGFKDHQVGPAVYTARVDVTEVISFTFSTPQPRAFDTSTLTPFFDKNYPNIEILEVMTIYQSWLDMTAQKRLTLLILIAVTLLTICLAVLGINGLTLMTTHQKKYEIAVRMATGAKQQTLINFVLKHTLPLLVIGLAIGFTLSVFGYEWLQKTISLLPDFNWLTLTFLDIGLVIVVLLSVLIPTWRVIRQDPLSALRQE